MSFLGAFPVLRLGQKRDSAPSVGFLSEHWCAPQQALAPARDLARAASAVLVVGPHVTLDEKAAALWVPPDCLGKDVPLGFLARSHVTGLFVGNVATLIPARCLDDASALPHARLTFPYRVGALYGNATPESAFEHGFRSCSNTSAEVKETQNRQALAASLGPDVLNGVWWCLGALHALRNDLSLTEAWNRHEPLLDTPNDVPKVLGPEARATRLATGIPVQALSPAQSRALKAMLSPWPDGLFWDRFAADAAGLDATFQGYGTSMQRAARRIWPDLPPLEEDRNGLD
ncbi:MAG: hypothetical protein AAGK71_11745 [Pseudomonadota bacterium]